MNKQKHLKTNSKNISQPKSSVSKSVKSKSTRHSIILTVVMAFLAGAVVLFAVALQSFKMVLLENSLSAAHGKAYFATECNASACEKSIEDARIRHHGELVGETRLYQDMAIGGGYNIISLSAISDFLIANPSEVPKDKVPVLVPSTQDSSKLPTQFFVVGSYDTNTLEDFRELKAGIFTPVFGELMPNFSPIYLVDDGSDKIQNFLSEQHLVNAEYAVLDSDNIEDFLEHERSVIVFTNSRDALNYEREISQIDYAITTELISNIVGIDYAFTTTYILLLTMLAILVVLVVEIIIVLRAIIDFCANKNQ